MLRAASRVSTSPQLPASDRSSLLLTTNDKPQSSEKPAYVYGKYPHVLSGVIACGYCRNMGLSFPESVMGQYRITEDARRKAKGSPASVPALKCMGGYRRKGDARRHPIFALGEHRIAAQWEEYVARIVALPIEAKHLATWRSATGGATEIAQADQMEAAIRERRALILVRLGYDSDEAVLRQVRAALRDLDADDQKLQAAKKQAQERPAPVDDDTLRNILRRYVSVYERADPRTKNGLNRALVAALGSMPTVKRFGPLGKGPGITKGADLIFAWPEVDAILEAKNDG